MPEMCLRIENPFHFIPFRHSTPRIHIKFHSFRIRCCNFIRRYLHIVREADECEDGRRTYNQIRRFVGIARGISFQMEIHGNEANKYVHMYMLYLLFSKVMRADNLHYGLIISNSILSEHCY